MTKQKYKNNLSTLNEYLFEQLDALSNPDLDQEELKEEINRSKAIVNVSNQIIKTADLSIRAMKLLEQSGAVVNEKPIVELIGMSGDE